jgi:hypothetical protein
MGSVLAIADKLRKREQGATHADGWVMILMSVGKNSPLRQAITKVSSP